MQNILASNKYNFKKFEHCLKEESLLPLRPDKIETFQINLGKMCNQTCHHCHVDAGPDRKEIMTKETMQTCLDLINKHSFKRVDLTGGAPEMNPHFRWFVEEVYKTGAEILDRCNLTILTSNKTYRKLPDFFREHKVQVISSLPHYSKRHTDRQRGDGVFARSIEGLQMLNNVGYGMEGSGLELNLVYNPSGCFLPGDQKGLEREFKSKLKADFGIEFNQLFCITNMPISRYLDYLIKSDNIEEYMNKLIQNFNPDAAKGVMCKSTLSVSWDGYIYDCDFNQMLDLKVACKSSTHLKDFSLNELESRDIRLGQHCYGCTAGSGSSCGGETA